MNIKDNLLTGLLIGIASPLLAFSMYAKIKFPEESVESIYHHVKSLGIVSAVLSMSVFVNLLVFFLFIWSHAERSARGVLVATFIYAFAVVILKLT